MPTFIVHENGASREVEMSPQMEAAFKQLREWDGWCKCGSPEVGKIVPRGHSVDVMCKHCAGWIQIG